MSGLNNEIVKKLKTIGVPYPFEEYYTEYRDLDRSQNKVIIFD
jgi:hypothetical protein